MKRTLILASIVAMLSTGAIAGNTDLATADPDKAIAPTSNVTDWSGSYVGLSYSSVDGTLTYNNQTTVYEILEDSAIGVFAGYNWQSGNLVYGSELNVTERLVGLTGFPTEYLGNTIELRGRGGYAIGDTLAYGFLGYSKSDFTNSQGTWDVDGVTYGLGVDYMVTTSIFAGLEFSNRELSGATVNAGQKQESSIDMISLRLGYKF
jgi:opacity protein-like surface antigen